MSKIYLLSFFFFSLLLLWVNFTFSAELLLSPEPETNSFKLGEVFELKVFLKTLEKINAFEGELSFSSEILELKDVMTGNSLVSLWVKNPLQLFRSEDFKSNQLEFSGIFPGGYQGEDGFLFSVFFKVRKEGQGRVEIKNARVLLNDGLGTPAFLSFSNFYFSSSGKLFSSEEDWRKKIKEDKEVPEFFIPQVAYDQNIDGGKWFIAFFTSDKQSGISHYEIKEVRSYLFKDFLGKWIRAESPYILKDQSLRSYIFIKAIDRNGNERVVRVNPFRGLEWYRNLDFLILGGGGFIILLIFSIFFTKFIKFLKRI